MVRMTKILMALIVACFAFQATAQENPAQTEFKDLRETGTARVERMVDPITMLLDDGRLLRLSSLELPGYDPFEPGDLAMAALAVMDDLLREQDIAIYQTHNKETGRLNRMGHSLAHIKRLPDHVWAQGLLLRLGLARVNTSVRNSEMAAEMLELEKAARDENLGLWGESHYKILTPDTTTPMVNSFQIVEGKIHSASMKNNRIYLNFGANWREDFTVSIPSSARRLFSKAGYDPLTWGGKHVQVRGWVEDYNGPSIEIDHPEAIKLLEDKHIIQTQTMDK